MTAPIEIGFFPRGRAGMQEMISVAEYLRSQAEFRVRFFCTATALRDHRETLRVLKPDVREFNPDERSSGGVAEVLTSAMIRIEQRLGPISESHPIKVRFRAEIFRRKLERNRKRMAELFDEYPIRAAFVSSDRAQGFEAPLIQIARERGIWTAIPPIANPDSVGKLHTRRNDLRYQVDIPGAPPINARTAERHPDWVRSDEGRRVLFFEPAAAEGLALAGFSWLRPWTFGSGVDCVFADGEETRATLLRDGLETGKVTVSGHPAHDALHESSLERAKIREQCVREYGLDAAEKLVLLVPPQLAEHGIIGWPEHRKNMDSLFAALRQSAKNVMISLHPRSKPEDYLPISKRHGIPIVVGRDARDLIPASDVFVACQSSTIAWAILCGVPAINADLYGLGYTTYDAFAGVRRANTLTDLSSSLTELLENGDFYRFAAARQLEAAPKIGILDGKARERIAARVIAAVMKR